MRIFIVFLAALLLSCSNDNDTIYIDTEEVEIGMDGDEEDLVFNIEESMIEQCDCTITYTTTQDGVFVDGWEASETIPCEAVPNPPVEIQDLGDGLAEVITWNCTPLGD